jgi:hypothetical protein
MDGPLSVLTIATRNCRPHILFPSNDGQNAMELMNGLSMLLLRLCLRLGVFQQLRGPNFAINWPPLPASTVFILWEWTKTNIFWPPPPSSCPRSYWMAPKLNKEKFCNPIENALPRRIRLLKLNWHCISNHHTDFFADILQTWQKKSFATQGITQLKRSKVTYFGIWQKKYIFSDSQFFNIPAAHLVTLTRSSLQRLVNCLTWDKLALYWHIGKQSSFTPDLEQQVCWS